jgi:asparagine N-glycosylation enzyme membrane subunit Stt3
MAGLGADVASASTAIATVAALTAASGLLVAATPWQSQPDVRAAVVADWTTAGDVRREGA